MLAPKITTSAIPLYPEKSVIYSPRRIRTARSASAAARRSTIASRVLCLLSLCRCSQPCVKKCTELLRLDFIVGKVRVGFVETDKRTGEKSDIDSERPQDAGALR